MRVKFIWNDSDDAAESCRLEMSAVPRVGDTITLTDHDERRVIDVTWFLDLDDAYPEVDHPYPLVVLGDNEMFKETKE